MGTLYACCIPRVVFGKLGSDKKNYDTIWKALEAFKNANKKCYIIWEAHIISIVIFLCRFKWKHAHEVVRFLKFFDKTNYGRILCWGVHLELRQVIWKQVLSDSKRSQVLAKHMEEELHFSRMSIVCSVENHLHCKEACTWMVWLRGITCDSKGFGRCVKLFGKCAVFWKEHKKNVMQFVNAHGHHKTF